MATEDKGINDADTSNDEFEKAFNEFAGVETEQDTVDEEEPLEEDQSNGEAPELDELGIIKQQLEDERNERKKLQEERDYYEHSFNSQRGRVSALQKKIDSKQDVEAPKHEEYDDSIKGLVEDMPDLIKPVVDYFEKKIAAMQGGVNEQLTALQAREQEAYIHSQLMAMNDYNPDWRDVIASEPYKEWLNSQPRAIQSMAQSYEAADYKYLLNAYNQQTKGKADEITESRQRKLAANVSIKSKSQNQRATAPDDFESAFDYYASRKVK